MKYLKKLWGLLNGNKRISALVILLAVQVLRSQFPDLVTEDVYNTLLMIGNALGITGIVHAGAKSEKTRKVFNLKKKI